MTTDDNGAMDINGIMEYLPHRYPFLLVDRVLACEPGKTLRAIKNVTMNEPFFAGPLSRPSRSCPGVLVIEALAQASAILAYRTPGPHSTRGRAVPLRRHRQRALPAPGGAGRPAAARGRGAADRARRRQVRGACDASTARWRREAELMAALRPGDPTAPARPAADADGAHPSLRAGRRRGAARRRRRGRPVFGGRAARVASARARSSGRTSSLTGRTTIGARNRFFQFSSIGEIPQDRKYGGEPTTTTIGDDNVVPRVRLDPCRHRAGPRRHRGRQRQPVPRLHARRARLRRRQSHDVLQQRADRRPRRHRRLGGDGRLRRRASVLPRRRARDGRRRLHRAAGRAAVHHRPGLSGQAARHQQRGPAPARLHDGGYCRGPPRLQDALPRGPDARGRHARHWRSPPRRRRRSPRWSSSWPTRAAASCAEPPTSRCATRTPVATGVTIGIVAGEASGDALAATLIHAVRARIPQVRFVGIAGPKMQAAGCDAWYPLETLAVRGFAEVVGHLPELFRIRGALARRLLAERVPVFVGVDAPDFNLGLERRLKRHGVRTVHFVSPSVWAWRRERVAKIGKSVDRMLALFPFEPPVYEAAGVPVTFVGHPLAQAAAHHGVAPRDAERSSSSASARAGVRAVAGKPRVRARHARRPRAADGRGDPRSEARRAFPGAARDAADARPFRGRALSAGPREAAADAALRACGRRAAGRRRRAGRFRHRDARSGARALPARHLLSGDAAHVPHRPAQAAAAVGRAAQCARAAASSCRSCCRTTRRSTTSRRRRSISTTTS